MKAKKKYFVSVAGNIGSGKSSLTEMIAKKMKWVPYYESVENNPYLEDFYNDMKRWSFQLQVFFLSHRFRTHKRITTGKLSVIQDRSIYEDVEIFAKNLFQLRRMEKRDYYNYKNLFKEMVSYLKPPDLIIYLKANVETLLKQIKLRGRKFEKSIDEEYIRRLNLSYNQWIKNYRMGKVLVIESDKIDFVRSFEDFDFILKKMKSKLT